MIDGVNEFLFSSFRGKLRELAVIWCGAVKHRRSWFYWVLLPTFSKSNNYKTLSKITINTLCKNLIYLLKTNRYMMMYWYQRSLVRSVPWILRILRYHSIKEESQKVKPELSNRNWKIDVYQYYETRKIGGV